MRICHTNRFLYFLSERKKEGGKVIFRDFVISAVEVSAKKWKQLLKIKIKDLWLVHHYPFIT